MCILKVKYFGKEPTCEAGECWISGESGWEAANIWGGAGSNSTRDAIDKGIGVMSIFYDLYCESDRRQPRTIPCVLSSYYSMALLLLFIFLFSFLILFPSLFNSFPFLAQTTTLHLYRGWGGEGGAGTNLSMTNCRIFSSPLLHFSFRMARYIHHSLGQDAR